MSTTAPEYFVAVTDHDGGREDDRDGPLVLEQYLKDCTREGAHARLDQIKRNHGHGGSVARLDLDPTGDDGSAPFVVIASNDGVKGDGRGPLVWETYLPSTDRPLRATRAEAQRHAAELERRYGACRIARLVFEGQGEPATASRAATAAEPSARARQ